MLNVKHLTPAAVLMRLYNAAISPRSSRAELHDSPLHVATEAEAQRWLDQNPRGDFDYVGGRIVKVNLSTYPELDVWLYDRDNGQGAAARARRRASGPVPSASSASCTCNASRRARRRRRRRPWTPPARSRPG